MKQIWDNSVRKKFITCLKVIITNSDHLAQPSPVVYKSSFQIQEIMKFIIDIICYSEDNDSVTTNRGIFAAFSKCILFFPYQLLINPFVPNAPFLYLLKQYFQGLEKECIGNEWVNIVSLRQIYGFSRHLSLTYTTWTSMNYKRLLHNNCSLWSFM